MTAIRTLLLATATTLAALALTTTAANAASPVEASVEEGEHCDIAVQNCEIVLHSTQEPIMTAHLFGFEFEQGECEDEFTAYLDESGSGQIRNQIITQHTGDTCGRTACGSLPPGPADPWSFTMEEDTAGEETMRVVFCFENLPNHDNETYCTVDVHVTTDHHSTELSTEGPDGDGQRCEQNPITEFLGHWIAEPDESDEIALVH
jgi:hypothetical protein